MKSQYTLSDLDIMAKQTFAQGKITGEVHTDDVYRGALIEIDDIQEEAGIPYKKTNVTLVVTYIRPSGKIDDIKVAL